MPNEHWTLSADASDLERTLLGAARDFEKMDKEALQAAGAVGAVGNESKKAAPKMDKASFAAAKSAKKMREGASAAAKFGKEMAVGVVGGLAAVAAAAFAVSGAIQQTADFMSEFVDQAVLQSEQIGLSTETLMGMRFAMSAAGTSIESVGFGLATFTKSVGDAASGSKEAADKFKDLGVAVNTADGRMRSADEVLRDTLAAISELPTKTERASAALDIFGTRGGAISAALGDGGDVLDEWTEKAKEAGLVIGGDLVQASSDMDVAATELDLSLTALKVVLGEELTPAVVASKGAITESLDGYRKWLQAIQDLEDPLREVGFLRRALLALTEDGQAILKASAALTEDMTDAEKELLEWQEARIVSVDGLTDSQREAAETTKTMVKSEEELRDAAREAAKALAEQVKENKRLFKWERALFDFRTGEVEKQQEAMHEAQLLESEDLQKAVDLRAELMEANSGAVDSTEAMTDASADLSNTIAESASTVDILKTILGEYAAELSAISEAVLANALKAFGVTKSGAKAQIIMDGAVLAVSLARAMAALGPIGVASGIGIATGITVAQLAALKKAKPPKMHTGGLVGGPPTYMHTGGVVGSGTGISPPSGSGAGERQITALVGEHYEQPEQRAIRGGGDVRHVWQVDHRTFEASLRRSRIRGGEMGQATASDGIGQRRRQHG